MKFLVMGHDADGVKTEVEVDAPDAHVAIGLGKKQGLKTVRSASQMDGGPPEATEGAVEAVITEHEVGAEDDQSEPAEEGGGV